MGRILHLLMERLMILLCLCDRAPGQGYAGDVTASFKDLVCTSNVAPDLLNMLIRNTTLACMNHQQTTQDADSVE